MESKAASWTRLRWPWRDGLLVPCGDVDGLADALGRLARDAGLRSELGSTGRARVSQEFRWKDKLELVRWEYEKAVGKGK